MYAYVSNESWELTVINGAPPGYTSCERVGKLPGCRFKFDEPDAQCSSGRSGRLSESPHAICPLQHFMPQSGPQLLQGRSAWCVLSEVKEQSAALPLSFIYITE